MLLSVHEKHGCLESIIQRWIQRAQGRNLKVNDIHDLLIMKLWSKRGEPAPSAHPPPPSLDLPLLLLLWCQETQILRRVKEAQEPVRLVRCHARQDLSPIELCPTILQQCNAPVILHPLLVGTVLLLTFFFRFMNLLSKGLEFRPSYRRAVEFTIYCNTRYTKITRIVTQIGDTSRRWTDVTLFAKLVGITIITINNFMQQTLACLFQGLYFCKLVSQLGRSLLRAFWSCPHSHCHAFQQNQYSIS